MENRHLRCKATSQQRSHRVEKREQGMGKHGVKTDTSILKYRFKDSGYKLGTGHRSVFNIRGGSWTVL